MKSVTIKIIKLNIIVFFLWFLLDTKFMMNNFLVSTTGLIEGKFWTLITSVFSHNIPVHLMINMFIFYGFGITMERILGAKRFLVFYLIAGIMGSFGHCLASTYVLNDPTLPALGASGAVAGVLVLFSLMFPTQPVFIFGLIPIPALLATTIFVGFDLWGLMAQSDTTGLQIGYGAHLGGALAGTIYSSFASRQKNRVPRSIHQD